MPEDNLEAPGAATEDVIVVTPKERAMKLYRAQHEIIKPKLQGMYDASIQGAEIMGSNDNTKDTAVTMRTQANQIQMMIDWGDAKFEAWYEADQKQFAKFDTDNSKELEASEFLNWVQELYSIQADEATAILAKWDVDADKSIGPYEFCAIMAVLHCQEDLIRMEEQQRQLDEYLRSLFCCGMTCFLLSMEWGLKCCPYTCGLSCCPFYCQMDCMTRQLAYHAEHAEEIKAKNAEDEKNAVNSKAKASLNEGPPDKLKSSILEQQSENTPLLSKA